MNIWIDAQLSPFIALWINDNFEEIKAQSVRSLGLKDATDMKIFAEAGNANVIIMSKDYDFINLLEINGPPPKIIWITCGNTSNIKLCEILKIALPKALNLLKFTDAFVEISDR